MREFFTSLFGETYAGVAVWASAVLVIALLLFVFYRIARSYQSGTFVMGGRNRRTRLAILDAAPVDNHRRLVLVRRDDVEHLILIGGPTDIVVEQNIRGAARPASQPAEPSKAPQAPAAPERMMATREPSRPVVPSATAAPSSAAVVEMPARPRPVAVAAVARAPALAAAAPVPVRAAAPSPAPPIPPSIRMPVIERPAARSDETPKPVDQPDRERLAAPVPRIGGDPEADPESTLRIVAPPLDRFRRDPEPGPVIAAVALPLMANGAAHRYGPADTDQRSDPPLEAVAKAPPEAIVEASPAVSDAAPDDGNLETDIDDALLDELEASLNLDMPESAEPASDGQIEAGTEDAGMEPPVESDQSLEEEMERLLGDLSAPKR